MAGELFTPPVILEDTEDEEELQRYVFTLQTAIGHLYHDLRLLSSTERYHQSPIADSRSTTLEQENWIGF